MLPSFLKPVQAYHLLRLGSKHDGGYLVEKESFDNSNLLISFGLSDNWEFEKDFYNSEKRVISFDDRLSILFLLKKFIVALIKLNLKISSNFLFKIFDYLLIKLKKDIKFHKKFISNINNSKNINLEHILKKIKINNFHKIFLKVDIEGGEYIILDDILKYQDYFEGIIIEFHSLNQNLNRIKNFINQLNHSICHIHCNNYAGTDDSGLPNVIELTLTKYIGKKTLIKLPHKLDQPNNPYSDDIKIKFDN